MDVDLEEYKQVIDLCDVFVVGFRLFPERLVVDARHNDDAGPMIQVVEPLASVQDRYHWLGQIRPSFGPPERFMFAPWHQSLQFFEDSGLMGRIHERLTTIDPASASQAERAIARLRHLEHEGMIEAVRGQERYRTLWPPN